MADNSKPLYCHWDSHLEDVPFMSEGELDMHIKAHFALHDEDTVACHWDACHELIDIDKIMDHFKETHQNNAGHPHHGDDPCNHSAHNIPSPPDYPSNLDDVSQYNHAKGLHLHPHNQLDTSANSSCANSSSLGPGADISGDILEGRGGAIGLVPTKIDLSEPYGYVRIHGSVASPHSVTSASNTPALSSLPNQVELESEAKAFTCEWLERSGGCEQNSMDCTKDTCGMTFATSSELYQHILEHHVGHGKKFYECMWKGCERCERPFPQRQKIMRHLQLHAPSRTYKCHVCGTRFSEDSLLKAHMRRHTTSRPFSCRECGRAFKSNRALTIHFRTHTGEKPLMCKFPGCGKKFADTSNLTKHMQIHGEKRFECPACHRKFVRRDHLTRHMRVHAPVSPGESVSSVGEPQSLLSAAVELNGSLK